MELLDLLAAFLAVLGLLLIMSGLNRRPTLSERLAPYHRSTIADEAERWLQNQK